MFGHTVQSACDYQSWRLFYLALRVFSERFCCRMTYLHVSYYTAVTYKIAAWIKVLGSGGAYHAGCAQRIREKNPGGETRVVKPSSLFVSRHYDNQS